MGLLVWGNAENEEFKKNLKIPLSTIHGMEKGLPRTKTTVKRMIQINKLIRGLNPLLLIKIFQLQHQLLLIAS